MNGVARLEIFDELLGLPGVAVCCEEIGKTIGCFGTARVDLLGQTICLFCFAEKLAVL